MKHVVADSPQIVRINETVALQSIFPAHLKYIGLSGKEYQWEKAGAIVSVNEEDAPFLLTKRIGRGSCCGVVSEGNFLFQKYEEAVNA